MPIRIFHSIANERGIALFLALIVLAMLTMFGLASMLMSTTEVNIAGNEKKATQALYLAEAGVTMVKSFFENPGRFDPPPGSIECLGAGGVLSEASCTMVYQTSATPFNQWPSSFFERRRIGDKNVLAYISKASGLSQFLDLDNDTSRDTNNRIDDGNTSLDANAGVPDDKPALRITGASYLNDDLLQGAFKHVGRIIVIEIYPPLNVKNYAVVRVVATSDGSTRVVEQEIGPSLFNPITAGAQTGGGAAWNGNGRIHWGHIKVEGDITAFNDNHIPSNQHCLDTGCSYAGQYDEWYYADVSGTVAGGPALCDVPECGDSKYKYFDYHENQPDVTIDKFDYGELKSYAKDGGYYYVVCGGSTNIDDGATVIYRGSCGNGAPLSFNSLTNGKTYELIFLEKDGSTTSDPGFTLSRSGAYNTTGNLYLNGNVDWGGSGSGKSTVIEDPDGARDDSVLSCAGIGGTCQKSVHINGLLYTTGSFSGNGNPVIYGALVAEGSMSFSGTPDIYYNAELQDGIANLPRASRQSWREIHQ